MSKKKDGFTLIEVIVVIAMLGIFTAKFIPASIVYLETAKEQVCISNCRTIERTYEIYLELEGLDSTELLFSQHVKEKSYEACPKSGTISYLKGKVNCSFHSTVEESEEDEEDEEDEVPFL